LAIKLRHLCLRISVFQRKMTDNDRRDYPLTGIGVLDLADEKASFCSKLLADLGARVIKIEKPGGDPSRSIGPFWGDSPNLERSLFFLYHNTNKLGITLNLENHDGKQILLELIRRNDIVVETFPPGYLDELGVSLKSMHEINPGLILVSVTDFGQDGPRKRYRSCDLVASAFGGQMFVSGSPETPPLKPFGEQSFYAASLFAAVGALLALRKRRKDGKGEHVDISLQESVTATLDYVMVRYFYDGLIPKREGKVIPGSGFCILPCKDGFMLVSLFHQWKTLVEWLDKEGMVEDLDHEKWENEEYRLRHIDYVVEVLGWWTKLHTTGELFEMGQLMHFPWAPVFSEKDVLESPQLKSRQFFVEIDHPDMNASLKYPGIPYKCRPQCHKKWKRAPLIGEDNSRILHEELGFSIEELERLACENSI
jgi:benzylsuccinate CoA-transferase BbsE subunit